MFKQLKNQIGREGSGGISFFGLLAILFIGLKLTNVITWSWWLVLSPIYAPFIVAIIAVALVACVSRG